MPLIPMNQIISLYKAEVDTEGNPVLDLNGRPKYGSPIQYRCRVDEGSSVVKNRSSGYISSNEDVGKARILIDKLAAIKYADKIEYVNELEEKITGHPMEINPKRGMNGAVIITEVII